jgi:hypothetical protein
MGAFTSVTALEVTPLPNGKLVVFSAVAPASYDAGGSTIDLSSAGGLGAWGCFQVVYSCVQCGFDATANEKYKASFLPASAGAAATGKLKVRDESQAADAEASGDLSAVTMYFTAVGR